MARQATNGLEVDLTVEEVAAHFGKGTSTVRTWLGRGELPGAYRLHGREWRIPRSAIETLQRAEAKRQASAAEPAKMPPAVDLSDWRRHLPAKKGA
jgi:excisionase family DNA binding protein